MLVPSGALYLDLAEEDPLTGSPTPILMNTFPFDGQDDVPAADAGGSHPLYVTVVDIGTDGLSPGDTHIFVTTDLGLVEVWNGTTFAAGWASSTFASVASDGGGTDDEHRFRLIRDTVFTSLEIVTVRVTAETTIAAVLDTTYDFQIEDLTKPILVSAKTRGLTRLRVEFDEEVKQGTTDGGDALLIRDITAGAIVKPPAGPLPARIEFERDLFTAADIGRFIGVAGADNALNNDIFEILSLVSPQIVEIDTTEVVEEELPVDTVITVSPYRVDGVPDPALIFPFFNPVVIAAETVAPNEVELTLHTDITQQRLYKLSVVSVEDLNGNVIGSSPAEIEFTTEPCPAPDERAAGQFNMVDFMPDENLEQDTSRDLERFLRVIDEPLQLLLCDVDEFTTIMDIDLIDKRNLGALLDHLGVPFSFAPSLSETDQRRLASILVDIYKRKGVEVAIEATVNFLLGFEIDIQPYLDPGETWIMGESLLGVDTFLGPGTLFLRYSFQVKTIEDLTETQRRRMIEIVNYMKPSHTHFVRIAEPSTPDIPVTPVS